MPRVGARGNELGRVPLTFALDHVGRDDGELVGCPLLGAHEREAQRGAVEQRCGRVAGAELEHTQLAPAVGQLDRQADVGDEVDAELLDVRTPTEVGGEARAIAERFEVAACCGAVERSLLGLELGRIDERLRVAAARARPARAERLRSDDSIPRSERRRPGWHCACRPRSRVPDGADTSCRRAAAATV